MSAIYSGQAANGSAYYKFNLNLPAGTYTVAEAFNEPVEVKSIVVRCLVAGAGFTSIQLKTSLGTVLTAAIPLASFTAGAVLALSVPIFPLDAGELIQAVFVGNGSAGSCEMFIDYEEPTGQATLD